MGRNRELSLYAQADSGREACKKITTTTDAVTLWEYIIHKDKKSDVSGLQTKTPNRGHKPQTKFIHVK